MKVYENLPPEHPEEQLFGHYLREQIPLILGKGQRGEITKPYPTLIQGGMDRLRRVYGPLIRARESEIRHAMNRGWIEWYLVEGNIPNFALLRGVKRKNVAVMQQRGATSSTGVIIAVSCQPDSKLFSFLEKAFEEGRAQARRVSVDDIFPETVQS
jgi:hypothetical protein